MKIMDIKKILSPLKTWKFWKELIIMTLGISVGAVAVNYFLVPSKLIIGTISGLSIVLSTIFQSAGINLSVSNLIVIINAVLLILAYLLIGKEFGLKTVYTALILGPIMDLYQKILPYQEILERTGQSSIMGDIWLDLCCFVLLLSISQALLFRINASTGGLDILAKIVNKYFHFDIGTSVTIAGAVICCSAFAINPFNMVVTGLIGTWINGLVVDYFTASFNKRKRVCIISDRYDDIRLYIVNHLHRGCSLYNVKGGYSQEDKVEIQALLSQGEFADLMKFLNDNSINGFITAGNCSEVYGLWNDRKRREMKGKL